MMDIIRARQHHAAAIAAVQEQATAHAWTQVQVHETLATPSTMAWVMGDGQIAHLLVSVAGPSADVLTIAVHPHHQRQGHARRLLTHAHTVLADAGVVDLFLEVRANNVPAIGLYQSAGYIQVGERRRYYRDGSDAWVMQHTL